MIVNIPLVLDTSQDIDSDLTVWVRTRKGTIVLIGLFFWHQSINRCFIYFIPCLIISCTSQSLYCCLTYIQVCYAKVYRYAATLHQLSPCCSMYSISVYSLLCMSNPNQFRLGHYIIVIPNYTIMVFYHEVRVRLRCIYKCLVLLPELGNRFCAK